MSHRKNVSDMKLGELVKAKRKEYKGFKPMRCHIMKEIVHFTFDGFEHLHMDGRKRRRGEKDARMRLMLMEYAPVAIANAKWLYTDEPREVRGKMAQHYELTAKVGHDDKMVVVIVRRVGRGKLHFYGIRYAKRKKQLA